jgi:ribulose-phosphate 3-epimerase
MRSQKRLGFSIEIDGGVGLENVEEIVRSGCDWLVSGSAIFHSADPAATVKRMQQLAESANLVKV